MALLGGLRRVGQNPLILYKGEQSSVDAVDVVEDLLFEEVLRHDLADDEVLDFKEVGQDSGSSLVVEQGGFPSLSAFLRAKAETKQLPRAKESDSLQAVLFLLLL